MNYLGFSYGSFLGQVYADRFPHRVRALVIDGVLDPVAWSAGRGQEAATLPWCSDCGPLDSIWDRFNPGLHRG